VEKRESIRILAQQGGTLVIRAEHIKFDYIRRDDNDNIIAVESAVNDVSFEVKEGEFVAILGHNGSGKSTLAKHMNALLTPESGTVWVDGIDTSEEEMIWEIRQRVGMVFQNPDNQLVNNVVEEDVAFGPENLGVPTEKLWHRVSDALAKVGMLDARKESPNNLSGGQKQRVAIAGILAMKPKCIVFDESTAMLDPMGRKDVLQAVQELNRTEHITILWITHYMEEVTQADKIIVMDHGEIVMEGIPKEIFSDVERLRQYHLDVPQVTLLAYELRKKGMNIPEGILLVDDLVDAIAYNLGR
jgi:energy-coupling factor transporter ATPase